MSSLSLVKTEAVDRQCEPLARLAAERTLIAKDLAEVDRKRARLGEAIDAKNQAIAAVDGLNAGEQEEVRIWVSSGCEGEQPKPDAAARARLTARLAATTQTAELAKSAAVDLDAEAGRLHSRLASIAGEMYRANLAAVVEQIPEIETAIVDAMRVQAEQLLRLKGLMIVLAEELSTALSRGDALSEAALRAAIVHLESLKTPTIDQNYQDMVAASSTWRARLRGETSA